MATAEKRSPEPPGGQKGLFDPEGFPWLENGERMDQKTFHERYEKTPPGFKAELIGGVVYVMSSPLKVRHGRSGVDWNLLLGLYSASTPGTARRPTRRRSSASGASPSRPRPC